MNDGLRHCFVFELLDEFIQKLDNKVIKPFRKKIKHNLTISRYPIKATRYKIIKKKNGKSRSTL